MVPKMKNYFSLICLTFCTIITRTVFAEAPIKVDLTVGYTYNDNITLTKNAYDIESDSILDFGAAVSKQVHINANSFYSLRGYLEVERYLDFDNLSNTRPGVELSYHIRPSGGYTATRYSVSLGYEKRIYDSEQRDGSAINLGLNASKRATDRITLSAGISFDDVSARESTFETGGTYIYLDVDYKLSNNNTLYITPGYFDGDVISTSSYSSKYTVRDEAFAGLKPQRDAYKVPAKTTSITLGDNYSIDANQALDVSVYYYDASASGYNYNNSDYSGLIYNLRYLYHF